MTTAPDDRHKSWNLKLRKEETPCAILVLCSSSCIVDWALFSGWNNLSLIEKLMWKMIFFIWNIYKRKFLRVEHTMAYSVSSPMGFVDGGGGGGVRVGCNAIPGRDRVINYILFCFLQIKQSSVMKNELGAKYSTDQWSWHPYISNAPKNGGAKRGGGGGGESYA